MSRILLTLSLMTIVLVSPGLAGADDKKAPSKEERSASETVGRRVEELSKRLHEALRSGQQEVAKRLQQEIRDLMKEKAAEHMRGAQERAEAAVKSHVESMEKRIQQLKEEGKVEFAERLAEQLNSFRQSRRRSEDVKREHQARMREAEKQMEESHAKSQEKRERARLDVVRRAMEGRAHEMERQIAELRERGELDRAKEIESQLRETLAQLRRQTGQPPQSSREAFRRRAAEREREIAEQRVRDQHAEHQRLRGEQAKKAIDEHHRQRDQAALIEKLEQRLQEETQRGVAKDARIVELQHHIAELTDRLHAVQKGDHHEHPRPDEERAEMERRLHNLRVAAENLEAIGMQDIVERLHGEIRELEGALHGPQHGPGLGHEVIERIHHGFEEIHKRMDDMQRRIDEIDGR